jgi:hypothetical protein
VLDRFGREQQRDADSELLTGLVPLGSAWEPLDSPYGLVSAA